ncbi:MAG: bifunctional DNA primase/polymerase [Thermoplasmatales archaeon]|nr:bifunctional DNA primase/polymerase [Thermoplasmatales archaeon]
MSIFSDSRFRVIKLLPKRKEPLEKGWTVDHHYPYDSPEINDWVKNGGNYGLFCPHGDCCFVDADTKEIQHALDSKLPTCWYSTGRPGHRQYVYKISDPPIPNIPLKDGAYLKGLNGYAVGPGSVHPNGTIYGTTRSNYPIMTESKNELVNILTPFLIRPKQGEAQPRTIRASTTWISLADLIDLSQFRRAGSQYQGSHPIHGSETGINLSIDLQKNVWHCFRHDSGGSVLEWIAIQERILDCADAVSGSLRGGKFWKVLEIAHDKYGLSKETAVKMIKGGK